MTMNLEFRKKRIGLRARVGLGLILIFLSCQTSRAELAAALPTVLHIASERHTSLSLNYAYFPQFVNLGFGTASQPWHTWFGSAELRVLLYLPEYRAGQAVEVTPDRVIGSRFQGREWTSGFAALKSFDDDHNGIVEDRELDDIYVWVDRGSTGEVKPGQKQLFRAKERYAGFDLRKAVERKAGYVREGLLAPFAVIMRQATRIHLLDLAIEGTFASEARGYLSYVQLSSYDPRHQFSGEWNWTITKAADWGTGPATWGRAKAASGRLILAVQGQGIRGLVQYTARHADRINLPLEGHVDGDRAEWVSVSPLGITRSVVTLSQEAGQPILVGTAWSNRNGKLQRWSWKATYAEHLK